MREIKAEILSIGTEILLGNIVNMNAQYLSRELASEGVFVYHQSVVGDNPGRLEEALQEGFSRADMIISTGGLGPTTDDLSKETAARYYGRKLVRDEKALANIIERMTHMKREITPNNYKQADLQEGCIPLYNRNGTAPGFILTDEDAGKTLIMLPGPPAEMTLMYEEGVRPYLKSLSDEMLVSRTLHLCGMGESGVEHRLRKRMDELTNPTLAPYAKTGIVDLRITAKAHSQEEAEELIRPVEQEIREQFGDIVFGTDEDTIESALVNLLREHDLKVAFAESCTAGLLAGRLVNAPGASRVFEQGFVTYSNEAKHLMIGVSEETLAEYGAVSPQTAAEMAEGAAKTAHTQTAVSVTGIAGPGGAVPAHDGKPEKPVGLVYIGYYVNGKVDTEEYRFHGTRASNRNNSVVRALNGLRMRILQQYKKQ